MSLAHVKGSCLCLILCAKGYLGSLITEGDQTDVCFFGDADLELWEFWESIKKAKVDGEINHLGNITNAANNGVWQASAWFLERSNPNDWSKREKDTENTGKKEPIIVKIEFD